MSKLYYTPPEDSQFEELKEKAIEIWNTFDNEFGYVDEKVNAIKGITNVKDNFMYIVDMFDIENQAKLRYKLSAETRLAVRERMISGGQLEHFNPFKKRRERNE